MNARTRRFVATIGVVLFLAFWVWGAVTINDRLPDIWWLDLIFFAIAGIGSVSYTHLTLPTICSV